MNSVECVAPTGPPTLSDEYRLNQSSSGEGFGGVLAALVASIVQGVAQEGAPATPAQMDGGATQIASEEALPVSGAEEGQAVPEPMSGGEDSPDVVAAADASPGDDAQAAPVKPGVTLQTGANGELVAQELAEVAAEVAVPSAPAEDAGPLPAEVEVLTQQGSEAGPVQSDARLIGTAALLEQEATAQTDGVRAIITIDEQPPAPVPDDAAALRVGPIVQTIDEGGEKVMTSPVPESEVDAQAADSSPGQAEVSTIWRDATATVPEAEGNAAEILSKPSPAAPPEPEVVTTEGGEVVVRPEQNPNASPVQTGGPENNEAVTLEGEKTGPTPPGESSTGGVRSADGNQTGTARGESETQLQASAELPESEAMSTASERAETYVRPAVDAEKPTGSPLPEAAEPHAGTQTTVSSQAEKPAESPASEPRGIQEEFTVTQEASGKVDAEGYRFEAPQQVEIPHADVSESPTLGQARGAPTARAEISQSASEVEGDLKLVPQAAMAVRLALHSPQRSARLTLEPPQLGRLQVEITVDEDRVSALFKAGTESARQGLLQSMEHLRAAIEDHGVRVGNMTVLLDNGAARFAHNFANGQSSGERNPSTDAEALQEPAVTAEEVAVRVSAARMLDVVV